jgi:hypothetical protein
MKEKFVEKRFQAASATIIRQANEIIAEFTRQGLKMTLRQLYYQFISQNLFENTDKNYKRLASIISDARLAGLVDWDAIEDRGRVPLLPYFWPNVDSIIDASVNQYRKNRWCSQTNLVELWVEKQALAGVLEPIARQYQITLSVNKGYSSSSAMYDATNRIVRGCTHSESAMKEPYVLYLGDHDPSGEDMVRDIDERLNLFCQSPHDPSSKRCPKIIVEKLALTKQQIEQFDPPPNPAKRTDSRFEKYAETHGDESWEVDALPPNVLQQIIRSRLDELIDVDAMNEEVAREAAERKAAKIEIEEMRARRKKGKKK